jgi:hypothetical protein
MKRSVVVAALALVAGVAQAQDAPMMAGGQMPDPRQMSGRARPQEGDPAGRLTVRAIQGTFRVDDLGNRVSDWPKDGVVHLVAYDTDQRVTVESKPLDAEGRAVFDGLATDGSKAYRALAAFGRGAASDRLISDVLVMPPQVGVRLMLAGAAPGSTDPAIDDQTQADDMGDGKAPPAGQVVVRLRGSPQLLGAAPIDVHLAEVQPTGASGDPREVAVVRAAEVAVTGSSDKSLEARFDGVPGDPSKLYVAWTVVDERRYVSTPVQLVAAQGASTGIFVYPALVMSFHGGAELDDQKLFFSLRLSVINPTPAPRATGDDGLTIPLPVGVTGMAVDEQLASRAKIVDGNLVWRGALPPGQRDIDLSFALASVDGAATFDLPLPFGAWQSQLVVEDLPGMTLTVPERAKKTTRPGPNGKNFVFLSGINLEPDRRLLIEIRGLPQPEMWLRVVPYVVGTIVLGLLGWAAFGLYRGASVRTSIAGDERERLYEELVAVETRFASRSIDEARYKRERTKLVERLASLDGGPGAAS